MNHIMINDKEQRIERIGNSFMTSCLKVNALRFALVLLLMIIGSGENSVWGQTPDYSGTYYIASNSHKVDGQNNKYTYDVNSPANNYYLCPTKDWYFYKSTSPYYIQYVNSDSDNGQPFLTTFKCRDGNHNDIAAGAVWIVEKHQTEANCYYIIQKNTSKYMVSNGVIGTNVNRMRVHLEQVANATALDDLGDLALFEIIEEGGYLCIKPHSDDGKGEDNGVCDYLVVNNGNSNTLQAGSTKQGGPNNANTGGIIGVYKTEVNAYWFFEDYITRPTITFNSSDQVVITAVQPGATLIYTTDGSTPKADHGTPVDANTYTFNPADNETTIKAVAVVNGELSNVAILTTPVLPGRAYLFKSMGYQSTAQDGFFMQPGDKDNNNNTTVTTSSLARPQMQWYFKAAGEDAGYLYFNIVNETGDYLFCNSSGNVYMKPSSDFDASSNDYKFRILVDASDGYRIVPKSRQTHWIYKNKGNNATEAVGTSNNTTNLECRWDFIRAKDNENDNTMPAALRPTPFTRSNTTSTAYYKIGNVNDATSFIVPGATYATTSNSESNDMKWFFLTPSTNASDDWLDYCYIVNAVTGKYLYFRGNVSTDNNVNAFEVNDYDSSDDDRYRFVVAKTTESASAAGSKYYIVPKVLKDLTYTQYMLVWRDGGNALKTNKARGDNARKWTFTPTTYTCAKPNITLGTSGYEITASEPDAKIYYMIGEGELTPATGTLYTGAISVADLGVESTTIRAIAARNIDGSDKSTEESIIVNRVAAPSFSQVNGRIVLTSTTPEVNFYYEMGDSPSDPTTSSTRYTGPIEDAANKVIKAIAVKNGWINSTVANSGPIEIACATPVITRTSSTTFTIECSFPTSGVTIYYTKDGTTPTTSSTPYSEEVTFSTSELPFTVKAIAVATNYTTSGVATKDFSKSLDQDIDGYYVISDAIDFNTFLDMAGNEGKGYKYKLTGDIDVSGTNAVSEPFTGELMGVAKDDGTFPVISGIDHPIFYKVEGGVVKNIILELGSTWSNGDGQTHAGAIANVVEGTSEHVACIYNCGILSGSVSGSDCVGSLVGLLGSKTDDSKCYARVINCFSYATISGGTDAGGIVGYNAVGSTQTNIRTMVMNCMFYGNGVSGMKPVYGGQRISNAGTSGINNYNYYRNGADVTFDDGYANFDDYYCTLPADEEYLTRFEYYRSILNSNRQLCTYWVTGKKVTDTEDPTNVQTAADTALIAKWVLDPEIAPYPILKKWGMYPSVINQDKTRVWDPRTEDENGSPLTPHWVNRLSAPDYQGKQLGTISVNVNAGAKHAGSGATTTTLSSVIVMDMDTLNHDYCYAKIQLPYYNEVFGDPTADAATDWDNRYAGNYKEYVVTGWKITAISGGTPGNFKGYAVAKSGTVSAEAINPDVNSSSAWEDGFNFADRNCKNKDLYSKSGRVFAQGGYYYVPEGVTGITIEAYWGKAVYLHNKDHSMDRVNVAAVATDNKDGSGDGTGPDFGSAFTPAGTLSTTFQTYTVKEDLQAAIAALTNSTSYTVYDQAIVLVGNVQVKNRGGDLSNGGSRAFTIMSCDLDLDNEPDYCLQFQQRNTTNRPAINPARFDFLPVPELGLAIRTNTYAYAIGIMVPKGHFEITETSFMHTTQFEYDANVSKTEAPLILNGGHFEQIVVRYGPKNKTSYILMGGNFRMKRFTPGYHATPTVDNSQPAIRHCAVNAIGGEYPEFYLSGIYAPDKATLDNDNPHCYTNGGYFGLIAGAGYEQVKGDVTFKIDHSIIREFYGGGINAAKPVTGEINVTINNSLVGKYCGGPKVGVMSTVDGKLKTVTTNATGTTFGMFYGGGNGGTSYYREKQYDNTRNFPTSNNEWKTNKDNYTPNFNTFTPLNQEDITAVYKNDLGYHAEYEFEVFNASNGLNTKDDVIRLYYHWAQFGTTTTGDVTNTLTNCTVTGNFFGGGNLANVTGNVTSILKGNTHVNGSVFAGGYSASIPSFPVHNKNNVTFPAKDKAGNVAEQGSLEYYQDGGKDRMYTWCYKNASGKVFPDGVEIPADASTSTKLKSVFKYPNTSDGKWYVLTNVSLEGLGAVSGDTSLTISEECQIDGNVFGGGDASVVNGNTTVTLKDDSQIEGNVFGGGNKAEVTGSTTVNMEE